MCTSNEIKIKPVTSNKQMIGLIEQKKQCKQTISSMQKKVGKNEGNEKSMQDTQFTEPERTRPPIKIS